MHVVSKAEAAEIGSHLLQLLVILTAVEVREVDLVAAAGAHPPHSGTPCQKSIPNFRDIK